MVRGVHIVGEMDVPRHSAALTKILPEVFGFESLGNGSQQLGICDFTSGSVLTALQTIFDEISAVFPSSGTVHMGGDKVSLADSLKAKQMCCSFVQPCRFLYIVH